MRNRPLLDHNKLTIDDDGLTSGMVFIRAIPSDLTSLFSLGTFVFVPQPLAHDEIQRNASIRISLIGESIPDEVRVVLGVIVRKQDSRPRVQVIQSIAGVVRGIEDEALRLGDYLVMLSGDRRQTGIQIKTTSNHFPSLYSLVDNFPLLDSFLLLDN